MSIDPNLLIAAKIVYDECNKHDYYDECSKQNRCNECQLYAICYGYAPHSWLIPDPPPEPTERPRIEWARMLPDKELIMAMEKSMDCSKCDDEDDPNCYQGCADGVLPWWHEVVTLEQFGKDVGLK